LWKYETNETIIQQIVNSCQSWTLVYKQIANFCKLGGTIYTHDIDVHLPESIQYIWKMFKCGYLYFCMEGTEHLNKTVKEYSIRTNNHFQRSSATSPYKLGDDSWVQLIQNMTCNNIINLHKIETKKENKYDD
jgi:hypothetical protein